MMRNSFLDFWPACFTVGVKGRLGT